jgi:hypothetical protein
MTNAAELITFVEGKGGRFMIDGERLGIVPKAAAAPVREELVRHKEAILGLVRERELNRLRVAFVGWFDARIHLDARGIALRQTPTWSTTVAALHRDCCQWMPGHSQAVPPTRDEFLLLLRELCCSIRVSGTEEFVDYVGLKDDIDWSTDTLEFVKTTLGELDHYLPRPALAIRSLGHRGCAARPVERSTIRPDHKERKGRCDVQKKVEFFEGPLNRCPGYTHLSNSEQVVAVRIIPLRDGYQIEVDRCTYDIKDSVVAAIEKKWKEEEISLRPRPRTMCCSGPSPEVGNRCFWAVTITKATLPEWKRFLEDLLTRPESWGKYSFV